MAATKYDFDMEKGSSFKISLIYKDSEGNPVNLTNWCARLVWKTNLNITQSFSTDNLDTSLYKFFIDGAIGKLTLLIPSHTTNGFNFKSAKYDLELQSPDELYLGGGKYTKRILYGVINVVGRYSGSSDELECQDE